MLPDHSLDDDDGYDAEMWHWLDKGKLPPPPPPSRPCPICGRKGALVTRFIHGLRRAAA
jgi:hypothetical protein